MSTANRSIQTVGAEARGARVPAISREHLADRRDSPAVRKRPAPATRCGRRRARAAWAVPGGQVVSAAWVVPGGQVVSAAWVVPGGQAVPVAWAVWGGQAVWAAWVVPGGQAVP